MTPESKNSIDQIRYGNVPEGYVKTRSGITPTSWTPACLGDIYTERKEPGNESLPLLTVSIHSGVSDGELDEDELPKKVKRIEDKSQYKRAATGDLVFNMMRAWQGAIGTVRTEGMVSPAYIVAKPNDKVYPLFMDYYMKTPRMVGLINRQSYGVTDFRKRLYWDSFAPIPCILPPVTEQRKIAEILAAQDKAIELQGRKIEELKRFKRGCLERMFPRKGQKVPEKRFPGFTGNWEQRKFDKVITQITTGLNPRDNFTLNSGGNNYYVTIKNFEHGILHLDEKCDLVDEKALRLIQARSDLKRDDILFTSIGRVGDCYLIKNTPNNWNINESVFSLRPNKAVVEPEYLFHTIHSDIVLNQILSNTTGSTFKSIKIGDLKNVIVPLPSKEEQRQIANLVGALENLITLHQRKLEEMKKQKKALMQLLLTGIVRTKGEEQ